MPKIYSDVPWLIPPDCEELTRLFREKGRPVSFKAREVVNFGEGAKAYLICSGLVTTFTNVIGREERLMAVFQPGTVLGAEKSIKGSFSRKPLLARALCPAETLVMDAVQFRREAMSDPAVYVKILESFIRHDDAKIEGLIVNDLLTVPERTALMIRVLFRALGEDIERKPSELPKAVSVTELATLVHSSRSVVSRVLSSWAEAGVIGSRDGNYVYGPDLSRALPLAGEE